jgi:hypothetical protein
VARKVDDCETQSCVGLVELRGEMETNFAELRPQLAKALEGVGNFRKHSERATKFFDRAEAMWEDDQRRRKRNLAVAIAAFTVLAPFLLIGCARAVSLGVEILQIEQQWKAVHPSEFQPQKSLFDQLLPEYAKDKIPQDAGNSTAFTQARAK